MKKISAVDRISYHQKVQNTHNVAFSKGQQQKKLGIQHCSLKKRKCTAHNLQDKTSRLPCNCFVSQKS